jgi:hypothetical protein
MKVTHPFDFRHNSKVKHSTFSIVHEQGSLPTFVNDHEMGHIWKLHKAMYATDLVFSSSRWAYLCFCLLGSLLSLPTFELLGLGSICTGGPSSDPSEPIAGMETFKMIEYKVEMFSNDQFFKYKLLEGTSYGVSPSFKTLCLCG